MPVEFETGNRLTIPAFARKVLKIKEGDCLSYRIEEGKIILAKMTQGGYPIKVRKLFRITFPKQFRELYEIKEKDKFYLEVIDGEIILQKITDKATPLTYIDY